VSVYKTSHLAAKPEELFYIINYGVHMLKYDNVSAMLKHNFHHLRPDPRRRKNVYYISV